MKLDPSTDQYYFWDFIWNIFALDWLNNINNDDETTKIIQTIFATKDFGVGYLVTQCPSLPNGLWSNHRQLICVDQVRYLVTGILTKQQYFEKVSTWTNFKRQYKPDNIILESVWQNVKQLLGISLQQNPQLITLIDVLKAEISNHEVNPKQAEYLGKLITSDFLQQIANEVEYQRIKNYLQNLMFLSKANNYNSANQLLVNSSTNKDEKEIAGFAEDERVLHPDYQENELQFFYACRQGIDVLKSVSDTDKIEWAKKAKNEPEKKKALNKHINQQKEKAEKKEKVQRKMEESSGLLSQTESEKSPEKKPIKLNSQEVLEKIYQWWQKGGDRYIKKYEEKTYPSGEYPQLSEDDNLQIQEVREKWMILFVLGATHTLGRTIPRHHRVFIETCQKSGWWQTFCSLKPQENSQEWINILDQYFDSNVDQMPYLHWLSRYPVIYLLDRYLEDYIEVFCSIEKQEKEFKLQSFLNTKTSIIFQRSDISLPPLSKVLGIGANFIVRELVRKNIIKKSLAYPHCFVSVKRVRELFITLGCQLEDEAKIENSITIYNFLSKHLGQDKATFNNSFDLPFLTIADNKDLQRKLLGHETNCSDED